MRAHWERYCFWKNRGVRRGGVQRDRHRDCEGLIRLWMREIMREHRHFLFMGVRDEIKDVRIRFVRG